MTIGERLEEYTASISGFEKRRNYVSLSHVALPEEEILKQYFEGFNDSHMIRLKCYKGYQMERDLVERIRKVLGEDLWPNTGISAFYGLVQGHPDLIYRGYPMDCKSVPLDEHLPPANRLPKKAYWQMQAYMKYWKVGMGYLIYESRESGIIRDYQVPSNWQVQSTIDAKLHRVVAAIQNQEGKRSA